MQDSKRRRQRSHENGPVIVAVVPHQYNYSEDGDMEPPLTPKQTIDNLHLERLLSKD